MRDTMASHLKDSAASLSVSPQRILAIASSISTVAEPTQLTHEAQDMIQQSLNTALDRAESLEHSEGLLMLSVLNNLQSASKGTDRNSTGHQAEAAAHTKFLKLLAHKIAANLAAGEDAVVMEHGDVVQHAKKNNIEDAVGENIGGCAMNHADTSSLPAVCNDMGRHVQLTLVLPLAGGLTSCDGDQKAFNSASLCPWKRICCQ